MEPEGWHPDLYVFNPFVEAYWALGKAFTPNRAQALMADDLRTLPLFLGRKGDLLLVERLPSASFLKGLEQAGLDRPDLVPAPGWKIPESHPLRARKLRGLKPWAWGPDSLELLAPLFPNTEMPATDSSAVLAWRELHSKSWGAEFLKCFLRETPAQSVLCGLDECGETAESLAAALRIIETIRARGHHRIVVKEALGLASHNALRLWEPELLEHQRRWITRATKSRRVVVEPWLEREVDFSIQLEMTPGGLRHIGYAGLVNDLRGQYQSNWAEPGFSQRLPHAVVKALGGAGASVASEVYRALLARLERELARLRFEGPLGIDAFVYRAGDGGRRLKPLVEINPRYTMGRLTLELMRRAAPASTGTFRLVSAAQIKAFGHAGFEPYAEEMRACHPLQPDARADARLTAGFFCLNDPREARSVLATFQIASPHAVSGTIHG